MLHLEQSHKMICEPETSPVSRAMGQVLLPHDRGGGLISNKKHRGHCRSIWGIMSFVHHCCVSQGWVL
jgi:hypothetical protein